MLTTAMVLTALMGLTTIETQAPSSGLQDADQFAPDDQESLVSIPKFPQLDLLLQKAESSMQQHAYRGGVTARVLVVEGDARDQGYDEMTVQGGLRLREVRSDRESRIVDGKLCERQSGPSWACSDDAPDLAMLPVSVSERVFDMQESREACGAKTCLAIDFHELGYIEYEPELEEYEKAAGIEPAIAWRYVDDPKQARLEFRLVVDEIDFKPLSVSRQRYVGEQLVEYSTWEFDYTKNIGEITLPERFEVLN